MREVKPTQKPVPSSDIKDLFFNSGLLDIWATSLEPKYIDRFGNCHLTAAGMEWLFKELVEKFKIDMNTAIVAAGYITIDSFQQGADLPNNELTQRNHILRDETTGEYYRWDGDLPKQVPAGSTPQSTGGIGKGAWVSVGDAALRSNLSSPSGSSFIYPCPDVATLRTLSGLNVGQEINLLGYHSFGVGVGGGKLYVSSDTSSPDDGFTCFITSDGKRVKRSKDTILTVTMAGAVGDGVHFEEDTLGFQRAADAGIAVMVPQPKEFYGIGDYTEWKGIMPANSGTYFYGDGTHPELRLVSSRCNIFSNFIRDFSAPNQTYGPLENARFEGLYFNGDMPNLDDPASASFPTGDNYSAGIYMCKCKNVTIKDCKFANFWYMGHNLFGVDGQHIEDCEYENVGNPNAYFPNYSAMGSDAWLSRNVYYNRCVVKNCGGILRANMGVNNLQVTVSENWRIENITAIDNGHGIVLQMGGFDNITYKNITIINGKDSHQIAISGNGKDNQNRNTPVTNVKYENINLINCMTEQSLANKAMVYLFASGGANSISGLTIKGGGGTAGVNDVVVCGGEYVNGETVNNGTLTLSNFNIDYPGAMSYLRLVTAGKLNFSDFTFKQGVTFKHINLVSGCSVNIRDGFLDYANPNTANFITRNWSKGSLTNVINFKTKSTGIGEFKDGDKVSHGLVESPAHVNVTKRQAGDPILISTIPTATDITFRMFAWNGNAITTPTSLSWEAYTWYEVSI